MENDKKTYRITIEAVGDESGEPFNNGMPYVMGCSGFAILTKTVFDDVNKNMFMSDIALHKINNRDIALIINSSDGLRKAGDEYMKMRFMEKFEELAGRAN